MNLFHQQLLVQKQPKPVAPHRTLRCCRPPVQHGKDHPRVGHWVSVSLSRYPKVRSGNTGQLSQRHTMMRRNRDTVIQWHPFLGRLYVKIKPSFGRNTFLNAVGTGQICHKLYCSTATYLHKFPFAHLSKKNMWIEIAANVAVFRKKADLFRRALFLVKTNHTNFICKCVFLLVVCCACNPWAPPSPALIRHVVDKTLEFFSVAKTVYNNPKTEIEV